MLGHPWMSASSKSKKSKLRITLTELLKVSTEWKEVSLGSNQGAAVSEDFQVAQIERIVDAIGMSLPSTGFEPSLLKYEDAFIRELAFDIGVDPRALKGKLSQLLSQVGVEGGSSLLHL